MADAVLSISTKRKRQQIEVDGKQFNLIGPGELNLPQKALILNTLNGIQKFADRKGQACDPAELEPVSVCLKLCITVISPELGADPAADLLTDDERASIIGVFFGVQGKPGPADAEPKTPAASS